MRLTHKRIRLVCLLAIVTVLLAGVGVVYARYSSVRQETLAFQAAKSDASRVLSIQSADGWVRTATGIAYAFSLENAGNVSGQRATLRLTATEGVDPTYVTVTLTVDGTAYRGTACAIEEGTPLYDRMGGGTEYRFYSDGDELTCAVSDDATYTLTVEGRADASLLRLTATEA